MTHCSFPFHLVFPAGILQPPFWHASYPMYVFTSFVVFDITLTYCNTTVNIETLAHNSSTLTLFDQIF